MEIQITQITNPKKVVVVKETTSKNYLTKMAKEIKCMSESQ